MASTLADVREEIGDTTEPYLFSETRVQLALDEAAEDLRTRGIDIDSIRGGKIHRLTASLDLIEISLTRLRGRPAATISEGGKSLTYTDLIEAQREKTRTLRRLLAQNAGPAIEIIYDNY